MGTAGYNDTKEMIISTLMGREPGTQIQPEEHQAYALNLLDYVRNVELSSSSNLVGIAYYDTYPLQPFNSKVSYIAGVGKNQTIVFQHFLDEQNNPITITTQSNQALFVVFIWNTQYWEYQVVDANVISVVIRQNKGQSTTDTMSQKAITDELNQSESMTSYVVCDTLGTDNDKILNIQGYSYDINGGSIKVKFENSHSISSGNVTLNINSLGAKPLIYNGSPVTSDNTWNSEEVVEIYFDGTNYNAVSFDFNKSRALTSFYKCFSGVGTPIKTVNYNSSNSDSSIKLFSKVKGAKFNVYFQFKNTYTPSGEEGDEYVMLKIGETSPSPLYYNGSPVTADNSWVENEVVEVYFDGTNYNSYNLLCKFRTGECVEDLSIATTSVLLPENAGKIPTTESVNEGISTTRMELLSDNSYYECSTNSSEPLKQIGGEQADRYVLTRGGTLKIKFTRRNNVLTTDTTYLKIGANTEPKELYYNGTPSNIMNSWNAGDTLIVFYDRNVFQSFNLNSSESDSTFQSGEKVSQTSITNTPIQGSNSLITSGGVEQSLIEEYNASRALTSFYKCSTGSGAQIKSITNISTNNDSGIELFKRVKGCCFKMFFEYANTHTPTGEGEDLYVMLQVNGTTPTPLYYNGSPVTAENSWSANEVLEVYFDGTKYNAISLSNSSESRFSTGELVSNTGIDNVPTLNSQNLITSGAVAAALAAFKTFAVVATYADLIALPEKSLNTIYLVGPIGTGTDLYEEYIFTYNQGVYTPVKIGDTSIDLSGYVLKTTTINSKSLSSNIVLNYSDVGVTSNVIKSLLDGFYPWYMSTLEEVYGQISKRGKYIGIIEHPANPSDFLEDEQFCLYKERDRYFFYYNESGTVNKIPASLYPDITRIVNQLDADFESLKDLNTDADLLTDLTVSGVETLFFRGVLPISSLLDVQLFHDDFVNEKKIDYFVIDNYFYKFNPLVYASYYENVKNFKGAYDTLSLLENDLTNLDDEDVAYVLDKDLYFEVKTVNNVKSLICINKPLFNRVDKNKVSALAIHTIVDYMVNNYQRVLSPQNKLVPDYIATNSNNRFVTDSEKSTWNGKYKLPQGGIPDTDLSQGVNDSLTKANNAVSYNDQHSDTTPAQKQVARINLGITQSMFQNMEHILPTVVSDSDTSVVETSTNVFQITITDTYKIYDLTGVTVDGLSFVINDASLRENVIIFDAASAFTITLSGSAYKGYIGELSCLAGTKYAISIQYGILVISEITI